MSVFRFLGISSWLRLFGHSNRGDRTCTCRSVPEASTMCFHLRSPILVALLRDTELTRFRALHRAPLGIGVDEPPENECYRRNDEGVPGVLVVRILLQWPRIRRSHIEGMPSPISRHRYLPRTHSRHDLPHSCWCISRPWQRRTTALRHTTFIVFDGESRPGGMPETRDRKLCHMPGFHTK